MAKNNVDGVYSADPKTDENAVKYDELSFIEVIQQGFTSNGFNSFYFMYGQ